MDVSPYTGTPITYDKTFKMIWSGLEWNRQRKRQLAKHKRRPKWEAQERAAQEAQQHVQNKTYQNCTGLRQDSPNGVASSHSAYTLKMDRDTDNWACER